MPGTPSISMSVNEPAPPEQSAVMVAAKVERISVNALVSELVPEPAPDSPVCEPEPTAQEDGGAWPAELRELVPLHVVVLLQLEHLGAHLLLL